MVLAATLKKRRRRRNAKLDSRKRRVKIGARSTGGHLNGIPKQAWEEEEEEEGGNGVIFQ